MKGLDLGPEYDDKEIEEALLKSSVKPLVPINLTSTVAELIAEGKIVCWFEGKMEMGARALGNRSILANPQIPDMSEKINKMIKHREEWRPFACSILREYCPLVLEDYDSRNDYPFMIEAFHVKEEWKSKIPAVIHKADGTTRPQTVSLETNPLYYKLIKRFYSITGCPLILNTSFNDKGQPIIMTPEEAVGSSSITQKDSYYKCYAVKSKSDEIRFASTSGGFFTEIATEILDNEGIVYGVGYSDSMDVLHLHVDNAVELRILQKSKYVQSDMRNVYKDIKKDADSGRLVLFVGCPCQVAAIYSFLGRKYANLYTVEFICMGVNSPLAYRAWIRELESNSRAKVSNIIFKYKRSGWRQSPFLTKVEFNNGHHVVLDESNNSFMRGYLMGGLFVRECCSKCIFNGTNRTADFVIGDHWGADKRIDDDKGTSVVILSTYHSKPLFERIKHRIECVEIDYTDVIRSNPRLTTSVPYNPEQERFYSLLNTCTFSKAVSSVVNKDEPLSDILMNIVFNKDGEK